MTAFARNIARALAETERILGSQTFLWKGVEIPCSPSSIMRGVEIMVGGNPVEIQLTLYVRLENFVSADSTIVTADSEVLTADDDRPVPVSGRKLKFRGQSYEVLTARQAAPQSHVELHLGDPNSGRKG